MLSSPKKAGIILLALSALRLIVWAAVWNPSGPLGTDPSIWGLTSLDLSAGNEPLAVPFYPWLMNVWPGDLIGGGLAVSWLSAWLLPLAAWWAAKPFGNNTALCSALLVLLLPDPIFSGFELQPDALTALWGVVLTGALLRERWAWVLPLAAVGLVLREHGGPVLGLLVIAAFFFPGPTKLFSKTRSIRTAGLLALAVIIPGLFGGNIGLDQPWSARSSEAVGLLTTHEKPPHLRRNEWQQFQQRSPFGRAKWHAERSLQLAPDSWAWLGLSLSLVVFVRDRRFILGSLPLLPVFGALIIWSERRHVSVLSPVAVLLAVCALSQIRSKRKGVVAFIGCLSLIGLMRLPEQGRRQSQESQAFGPVQAVAEKVCALASQDDLILTHDQRILLWCPLPQLADPGSSAAWASWLVAPPESIQAPWEPVFTGLKGAWIWRWSPKTVPRPCQNQTHEARFLLASGPKAHPAFPHIPMQGEPPLRFPKVAPCP